MFSARNMILHDYIVICDYPLSLVLNNGPTINGHRNRLNAARGRTGFILAGNFEILSFLLLLLKCNP